ncbi:N-succinyldiaminopimelate aminotransferase [Allochromatium warmingii]|uniref:N-succinyldiaminopimelate aminotransferase n=1 Tax=Allochromatium warmingii TaxID=61595 RepID=A0A1H3GHN3_ALLWA|nr:succinyldiaminopimelate transaminase [Allochromatium warmingii]SDY02823.1 N-succinyldiaminopimelate aminotransferase [Allochromatium warmingii]
MNPDLSRLQSYPFEKLAALTQGITPPRERDPIGLQIGEPKHPTPSLIAEALLAHLHRLSVYPTTRGLPELRTAIADWLRVRFQAADGAPLIVDPEQQILPVNGTREALFAIAQAVVDRTRPAPLVLMPNPCYQIYEGAAVLAGAEPQYLACHAANGFIPDFNRVDAATWERCQLLYICSPGNPTGAVLDQATLMRLIELAEQYDFVIASDECYGDLYQDDSAPPPGLLQAAAALGKTDFARCIMFHSLSKRSNAPGLRSGFVAGDATLIRNFLAYRTYHGCAMSLPVQYASLAAWRDEAHVRENRRLYREKFTAVSAILSDVLPIEIPAGGFFLWLATPIPDTDFARELYLQEHVTVLPGRFLSRAINGEDPGADRVRIALVAPLDECVDAAKRMRAFIERLGYQR